MQRIRPGSRITVEGPWPIELTPFTRIPDRSLVASLTLHTPKFTKSTGDVLHAPLGTTAVAKAFLLLNSTLASSTERWHVNESNPKDWSILGF